MMKRSHAKTYGILVVVMIGAVSTALAQFGDLGRSTGACCVGGVCYDVDEPTCTGMGGAYGGDGTVCHFADCNMNGTDDVCDVLEFGSFDCNFNLVPDECDPMFRAGDFDGDGDIDAADLDGFGIATEGPENFPSDPICGPHYFDTLNLDFDGDIDLADFAIMQQTATNYRSPAAECLANELLNTELMGLDPLDPRSPYLYVGNVPIQPGDFVEYGDPNAPQVFVAPEPLYVAWIDYEAAAGFNHPSRILLAHVEPDPMGGPCPAMIVADLSTDMPVMINGEKWWGYDDVGSNEHYFPVITYQDIDDPDAERGDDKGVRFAGASGASSLTIHGNSEEKPTEPTIEEVNDLLDDSGVPEGNRVEKRYRNDNTPTGAALETDIRAAIRQAAQNGSGSDFMLFLSSHGGRYTDTGNGYFRLNSPKGTPIKYSDFICWICQELRETNKRRIMLTISACKAGSAIAALNDLECEECSGMEIGIAAACGPDEYSYLSENIFGSQPWDFIEELEDEGEDWGDDDYDMFEAAEKAFNDSSDDIDNDNQHPQWGRRVFP